MNNENSLTYSMENFKSKVLEITNEFVKIEYKEIDFGISIIDGPPFVNPINSSSVSHLRISFGNKDISFF